ncbi:MAG: DNA polymerase III subunit chi [Gammaproteobacteria bacterium]|nr:DNA polymerase III subunit chi [Gammaproteobacteria bacterium]MBT4493133.1 DNA polymerase III subunit chi [Gammaproteobacteria bacterium]MBT7371195.1 DNA polymerase III subunit chi [Gammaproteobacteria bacterium]
MTRIDFYQINGDETTFACRLIDLVYRRGHQIYVHTVNADQAEAIDDLLWTFREDAFIPHALQDAGIDAPIKIGFNHEPGDHQEVLINLSGSVPGFFSRFDRVAEVVPFDKDSRNASRDNYAYYKQRGYSLNYHKIN